MRLHDVVRCVSPDHSREGVAPLEENTSDFYSRGQRAGAASSSPPLLQCQLVDLSTYTSAEVHAAARHLQLQFPRLQLVAQHTSGHDLQGSRLHSIAVRLEAKETDSELTSAEREVLPLFLGEAVAASYNGCMRRAMREAFQHAKIPFPGIEETAPGASVLRLFASLIAASGGTIYGTSIDAGQTVDFVVRNDSSGVVLSHVRGKASDGLRLLLAVCETAAEAANPGQHSELKQQIADYPLHIVLPEKSVRVKDLLRKLLNFYYGLVEEEVMFEVLPTAVGVFTARILARYPPIITWAAEVPAAAMNDRAAIPPPCLLSTTTGTSKKTARDLAAICAMQEQFPLLFEEKISYHPDIQGTLASTKATAAGSMCPPAARGIEAQLRWALGQQGKTVAVESVHLKPRTAYPDFGLRTTSTPVWVSQLFLLSNASPAGDNEAQRVFACAAVDGRKSRSEQKAMASLLAVLFAKECATGVTMAQKAGLIDASGKPTACHNAHALLESSDGTAPVNEEATESYFTLFRPDLVPGTIELPFQPSTSGILGGYWETVVTGWEAAVKGGQDIQRQGSLTVENTEFPNLFCARWVVTSSDKSAGESGARASSSPEVETDPLRTSLEVTASTEIEALFRLLHQLQDRCAAASRSDDSNANSISTAFVGIKPWCPSVAPLKMVVEAVASLYGFACSVKITGDAAWYEAELWGKLPPSSSLLQLSACSISAASVFSAEKAFYLGRGAEATPLMAVRRCAQQVYEVHIRPYQRPFPESVCHGGSAVLAIDPSSQLYHLTDAVLTEIKLTSQRPLSSSEVQLRCSKSGDWSVDFVVTSGDDTITLEEVKGSSILSVIRSLGECISSETGLTFVTAAQVKSLVHQTQEQLLFQLCRLLFGLCLQVDTCLVHHSWHCRVIFVVDEKLSACIGCGSGSRKRDTVERTCGHILAVHFPKERQWISGDAAAASTKNTRSDEATMPLFCDSYFFETERDASEK